MIDNKGNLTKANLILPNLQIRSEGTEAADLGRDRGQNGVDGREDGATIAAAHDELGHRSDDQHGRLGANLIQSVVQGVQMIAVDDLSHLH